MMTEETSGEIRPILLIGGGAALTMLILCGLISLVMAGGLLWFSSGRAANAQRATEDAVQSATEVPATAMPTLGVPTPLPAVSTPPPALINVPTPISIPAQTPDQAVRNYFQLVSQKRYDVSWSLLTDAFKQKFNCCAPTYNYTGYMDWWNSVNHVEFGTVSTMSQNQDRAVVYTELYYVMNTGARSSVDSNPYIVLVYDAATGNWRFDDKRATP